MTRFEDQLRAMLDDANVEAYRARTILQLCVEERRRSFIEGLRRAGARRPAQGRYAKPSAVQAGLMTKAERPSEAVRREMRVE